MTRTMPAALACALLIGGLAGCNDTEVARLRQENTNLVQDLHRLERETTDLRARLERTRNAIDGAQNKLDAAQSELETLPDAAASVADSVAAKLDDAADALDDASDAIDGDEGSDLAAPITVRTMPASRTRHQRRGAGEGNRTPV